jgi:hypothetical protein
MLHACLLPVCLLPVGFTPCCIPHGEKFDTGPSLSFEEAFEGNVRGWADHHPKWQTIRCMKTSTVKTFTNLIGVWVRGRRGQGFYKTFGWVKIKSMTAMRVRDFTSAMCAAEGRPGWCADRFTTSFLLRGSATLDTIVQRIIFDTKTCS